MSERAEAKLAALAAAGLTESVIYRPAGGDARTINALVDRETAEDHMHAATPRILIHAINDATRGIAASEIDTGGDRLDVARRAGGTAATLRVHRIVEQDDDWVTVEVR